MKLMKNDNQLMTEGNITKHIIRFSIPLLISNGGIYCNFQRLWSRQDEEGTKDHPAVACYVSGPVRWPGCCVHPDM